MARSKWPLVFVMIPFGSEQIAKEALDNIGYTGTIVPATNALDKLYEANADKENP